MTCLPTRSISSTSMSGRPGQQGNQMPVGLAIHRRRGNPELDPVTRFLGKTITGSARLNPDIEQ